jgi:hypothetical protein
MLEKRASPRLNIRYVNPVVSPLKGTSASLARPPNNTSNMLVILKLIIEEATIIAIALKPSFLS